MMDATRPTWHVIRRDPVLFVACGFGSGLSPRAPGTMGTLAAAVLWLAVFQFLPWWAQLALVAASVPLGTWLCAVAVERLGGVHDHQAIVFDEFAGLWIALLLAPGGWLGFISALVLFRVLDIIKPWPISSIDRRTGGGLGVMLDDVLAGLIAGIMVAMGLTLTGLS